MRWRDGIRVGLMGCLALALVGAAEEDPLAAARTALQRDDLAEARRLALLAAAEVATAEQRDAVQRLLSRIEARVSSGDDDLAAQRRLVADMLAGEPATQAHWQAYEDLRRRRPDDPLVQAVHRRVKPAWAETAGADDHGRWASLRVGRVLLRFRSVAAGQLTLPDGRELRVDHDFWIAETELTASGLAAILGTAGGASADRMPATGLTPDELQSAANAFGALLPRGVTGRLPTPDEWEFAARGGCRGSHLPSVTSLQDACLEALEPWPVASGPVSATGLYDLHGNVWELTRDRHGEWWRSGGGWRSRWSAAGLAGRYPVARHRIHHSLGLRLVLLEEDLP